MRLDVGRNSSSLNHNWSAFRQIIRLRSALDYNRSVKINMTMDQEPLLTFAPVGSLVVIRNIGFISLGGSKKHFYSFNSLLLLITGYAAAPAWSSSDQSRSIDELYAIIGIIDGCAVKTSYYYFQSYILDQLKMVSDIRQTVG